MGGEQPSAVDSALRALTRRDLSAHELDRRLDAKGFDSSERAEALRRLGRSGLVDDSRFAENRARALAARGAGDAAIRHDLIRAGVDGDLSTEAVAALEPESDRARRIVERRGVGPKIARYLRSKGFSEEAIAGAVAGVSDEELG